MNDNDSTAMNIKRSEYLSFILTSLHMKVDEFMISVAHPERCYERTIHRWMIKLFESGRSKEYALHVIFKARILYFIRTTRIQPEANNATSKSLAALLPVLKENKRYQQLPEKEKQLVHEKIDDLIGRVQLQDMVEHILNEMHGTGIGTKRNVLCRIGNGIRNIWRLFFKPN